MRRRQGDVVERIVIGNDEEERSDLLFMPDKINRKTTTTDYYEKKELAGERKRGTKRSEGIQNQTVFEGGKKKREHTGGESKFISS